MTIIEISVPETLSNAYNTSPFIYAVNVAAFTGAPFWRDTFGVGEDATNIIVVNELRRDPASSYDQQTSYNDVVSNEQSFYYDAANQRLYFHIEHGYALFDSTFTYGLVRGYSDHDEVYIDDIEYEPFIESIPSLRREQDLINYDSLHFFNGSIELLNLEGVMDFFINGTLYGATIDILNLPNNQSSYAKSDMTQLARVYVDDFDLSQSRLALRFNDPRKSQNITIPKETFSVDDYDDLDPELDGSIIPVLWGTARETQAICTNSEATSGDVEYRQALTLTSIGTVYVLQDKSWVSVTPSATNISTGEFTLSTSDARDSDGGALECKVNGSTGIAITYASDLIKDANERFGGIPYTASNYDLTEWAAEEKYLEPISYYLGEEKKLFEVIKDIQNGSNVGFRYEINNSGLRTIRADIETREVAYTIENIEILDRENLSVSTDSEILAADVRVNYDKSWVTDNSLTLLDTSHGDSVEKTYRQRPLFEADTYVTNLTDAQERRDYIIDRFTTIRGIFEGTLMGSEYISMRIFDIIQIELTNAFIDRDNNTITGREYYGIKKCKVIGVDPDIDNNLMGVRAVIISDAADSAEVFLLDTDGGEFGFELDDGEALLAY